jgi:F420-dependent oxidoreductase-like protein
VKFGLQINPYVEGPTGNPWDLVVEAAKLLDESSFDSLWLYDHFLYEGGYQGAGHPYPEPVMECFTTLSAIAAATNRVRLGQLVTAAPYRNPAMLAKMATSLDLISHGRLILGMGAGWHRREHEAYGWGPFEDAPVRLRRLEEALQVILKQWTAPASTFSGRFYHVDSVLESTHPVQQPHPPILIGGNGEKVTLRLVAQYAQMCNVQGEPADVAALLAVLRAHCQRLGRSYDAITRSMYATVVIAADEAAVAAKCERLKDYYPRRGWLAGTPAQLVAAFRDYAAAGIQYVIFRTPDWHELDPIRLFSEQVIPQLPAPLSF